jgi:primosomal protein N'
MMGKDVPHCDECDVWMTNYGTEWYPYWACDECHGTPEGVEAEWCEECGTPRSSGSECCFDEE